METSDLEYRRLPVPPFENVYADSNGEIWFQRKDAWIKYKLHPGKQGRDRVHVSHHGKILYYDVYCLVAKAFLGEKPVGMVCHHKNFDSSDNRPTNLEWITEEEHKALHARQPRKSRTNV